LAAIRESSSCTPTGAWGHRWRAATGRGTNLTKILNARHLMRMLNEDLAGYATDDIHDDPQRNVWKD